MPVTVADLQARLSADNRQFNRDMDSADKRMHRSGDTARKVFGAIGKLALAGGAAAVTGLGFSVKAASDLEESVNAVNVVFGKSAKRVHEFARVAATEAGLSMRELNQLVTPVGAALRNVGLSSDEAADASVNLARRAADMASVFNVDVSEALQAIQAGLRGEADPLERFGVGLNDAAIKAYAVKEGLAVAGEEMTNQQKVQARLGLLFEQTNRVAGDFANTSDSLANQTRIAKARLENLAASIGQKILPIVADAVGVLEDFVGFLERVAEAKSPRVAIRIIFTEVKGAVKALVENVRDFLFGTGRLRPIQLPTGKILEWEKPDPGFVRSLAAGFRSVNWREVGRTVGAGIGAAIDFGSDAIQSMLDWVDSHTRDLAEVGLKIGLTMISLLSDPQFWRENWGLIIGAAVAVFPIGRLVGLGGRMGRALASAFGRTAAKVITGFAGWMVAQFSKLPFTLRSVFKLSFFYVAFQNIREFISGVWDWLKRSSETTWGRVLTTVARVIGSIHGRLTALRNFLSFLRNTFAFTWEFITSKGQNVVDKVKDIIRWIGKLVSAIKDLPGKVAGPLEKVGGFFGGIKGAIRRGVGAVGGFGDQLAVGPSSGGLNMASLLAGRFGLTMTSGFRPGDDGWHGQNRARDYAGRSDRMLAFARAIASVFGGRLLELIYSPLGWGIKNGQRVANSFWGADVVADHFDHVHVAMRQGGTILARKPTPVIMGEGGAEMARFWPLGRGPGGGVTNILNIPPGAVVVDAEKLLRLLEQASQTSARRGGPSLGLGFT